MPCLSSTLSSVVVSHSSLSSARHVAVHPVFVSCIPRLRERMRIRRALYLPEQPLPLTRCFSFLSRRLLHNTRWSPEDDEKLVSLRSSGIPWPDIAPRLATPRSEKAMHSRLWEISRSSSPLSTEARRWCRVSRRHPGVTREDRDMALKLRAQGLTWQKVADTIGKGHLVSSLSSAVVNRPESSFSPTSIKRAGFTAEEVDLLHRLKAQGLRWDAIAQHFPRRSSRTLQTRWQRRNLDMGVLEAGQQEASPMQRTGRWTHSETVRLLQLLKEGKRWLDIRKELNRDSKSVASKVMFLQLNTGSFSQNISLSKVDTALARLTAVEENKPHPSKSAQWTPKEVDQLLEMQRSGASSRQLGDALDRSSRSISAKLQSLSCPSDKGKRFTRWSDEEIETLVRYRERGWPVKDIAMKLGRPLLGVENMIRKSRAKGLLSTKLSGGSSTRAHVPAGGSEEDQERDQR